ncbi:alpha/beta fold hydrolase [Psychromonas hadalis]|uniref:alpha/beta fold hydrolase n=1 Tax=Psychromonas hadalis TaxID=211669 RepID=UPI0003B72A02|nr:alpha/beta fold hydrolase [Psychromonas hadalis]
MKANKYSLVLIPLFLLFTTLTFATINILNNPFKLSSETALTNNYNAEILQFWKSNAKSSYFQGVDNKRVHTISVTAGNNKVIVISQGRNESVLKYKELAYDLNRQGYDVFLIDHRGQGFSERFGGDQHRGYVVNFQDYVDDLNQYVSSLQLDKKYQQRYLLSHSMGGAISALYLQQVKHPFQASVFFSPMLSIDLAGLPSWLAKIITYSSAEVCNWFSDKACYVPMGEPYSTKIFADNHLTHSETRFYSSQIDFETHPETQLGDPTMRWVATSISATEQAIENAHKINIPILIIQAGADEIVTSTGQTDFFNNVTYCKFNQFLTLQDAKHEILLERDNVRLDALNHALQFLAKIEQGKLICTK